MSDDFDPWEGARKLCGAGVLRGVNRAGFRPMMLKEELDLELEFEGPAGDVTYRIMTGTIGANDLRIARGTALELSAGHLRKEEPESWNETVAAWRIEAEPDAFWAIGAVLRRPARLEMTQPYCEIVGFAFDCERDGAMIGRLMIFASADILFAAREDDPEVMKYGLREPASG
jgi:hypothetical protein